MPDNEPMTEMEAYYARSRKPLFKTPTTSLGKLGCGLLLVIWFALLTSPCAMFWLATGRTITIPGGSVPDAEQYPRFEVRLIMETRNRGLQFTRASAASKTDSAICMETTVTYLLWESEASDNNVVYCQCYGRGDVNEDWSYVGTTSSACDP